MPTSNALRQRVAAGIVLAVLTAVFSGTLLASLGIAGVTEESDDEHTWRPKCNNSAFNQYYFEETDGPTNGDVQSGFVSNPPSSFVVTLVGPAKEFPDEGDTWKYNYESNTNDWYIWRIVFQPGRSQIMVGSEGSAQPQGESESVIIEPPSQRGTLTAPEGTGAPQWVVFCLVEAGSITIKENASPDNPQDFPFAAGPAPLGNFLVDDDPTSGSLPSSRNQVVPVRTPTGGIVGPYTVTQDIVSGWPLTSISCSGELGDPATEDLTARKVVIPLDWREDITCVFTNTRPQSEQLTTNGTVQGAGVLATTGIDVSDLQGVGVALLAAAGLLFLMISRTRTA